MEGGRGITAKEGRKGRTTYREEVIPRVVKTPSLPFLPPCLLCPDSQSHRRILYPPRRKGKRKGDRDLSCGREEEGGGAIKTSGDEDLCRRGGRNWKALSTHSTRVGGLGQILHRGAKIVLSFYAVVKKRHKDRVARFD